jgi:hypothetical protein
MSLEEAEKYKREQDLKAQKMFKPTEEGWTEAPITKFKETLGGSVPYIAAPIAGAVAGVGAAALGAPAAVAGVGAATIGALTASAAQYTGSNLAAQMEDGTRLADTSLLKAGATAIPQAALDTFSLKAFPIVNRIFGKAGVSISDDVAKEVAKKGMLATAGEYALAGSKVAGIEGSTEVGQEFLQRLQAGQNIADEEARKAYYENFIGGAVLGGAFGTVGHKFDKSFPQQKEERLNEPTPTAAPRPSEMLMLPAPEEQLMNDRRYDPFQNPLGNFMEGELTPDQIAYINKDRKDNNKPRISSYSLEDYVDAIRHSSDTAEAKQGALDNFLTFKTGYDGTVVPTVDTVIETAKNKNVETGTQGFQDFLMRTTGTDNLEAMSPVQLYSAFDALRKIPESETLQILPEGTNAVRFSDKQYNQALKNLKAEYEFFDTDVMGRTSVVNDIMDTAGLKDSWDAKALLRHAINRGDLEERITTRKVDGRDRNVVNIAFAGKSEALPQGFDIRNQEFKQGVVPENYEVKNGSVTLDRVKTAEEAQASSLKHAAINEKLAQPIRNKVDKLNKAIESMNTALDINKSQGYFGTPAHDALSADMGARIRKAQAQIAFHDKEIQNLTNPLKVVPVGEKPVVNKKHVFYDEEGKAVASFKEKDLAEQFGLMRKNKDGDFVVSNDMLQQIIDTAPTTKGTLPKRYASYAKKELERRAGNAPKGIEVRASIYAPKVEENFEKIRQSLLPTLKRFGLERVGLNIVKSIADGQADGSYVRELIKIAYNAENPMGTLRHESIHALKNLGAFTDGEWNILKNKAKSDWIKQYIKPDVYESYKADFKERNKSLTGFDDYIAEEAIAEAFANYSRTAPPAGLIGSLFKRLSDLFKALLNAFKLNGFKTEEDIFQKVESGKAKIKAPKPQAVSEERLSRQRQKLSDEEYFAEETTRPKAKKVIFEVAPDPNNKDLTERWNSLSPTEKIGISKRVADYVVKDALETFDSTGKVADQVGSYGEFTNPSLSLFVDSGDAIEIAKYLGYALSQDSMVIISPREKKGFDKTGAVVVDIGNKTDKEIDDIYQTLHAIKLGDENPVGGQSTINGKMVVLNYSNSTTKDLAVAIDDALKQKYNVAISEVYTAFPEKKDYDYGDKTNDPRGIGRVVRERSRAIRKEAAALIESELKKSGKGKEESTSSAINLLDKRVDNPNLTKPTVNDVAKYFDGLYPAKLDFSNVDDFNRAVKIATEEVQYQLDNERSGLDWYDEDISKAFKLTAKIIPELKQANSRYLFSVMAGIMSPQTNARDNWVIAAENFQNYVKTGQVSGTNPRTGGLWQGGTQSINKQKQLDFLNNMIQDMGEKKTLAWLVADHTVKEINDYRSKYGNIKSGIGGKMTDVVPALYAFGPKVGPFVSNLNGIYDVTVDKWMTRTFNRYFGTMLGKDGEITDAPTERQRTAIKNLINEVAKNENIKPYQAQSLLWFFEQSVFRELGTQSPSYGFGDGARKFSEQNTQRGNRSGVESTRKNKPATETKLDKDERLQIKTPRQIQDGARAIRAMDEDVRDNTMPADMEGGYYAFNLYEAQNLLPKPSDKLKKVTDRNAFDLSNEVDYIANVDGEYFGVVKDEDPDNEEETVYRHFRLDEPFKQYEPLTNDVPELFEDMRKHLKPTEEEKFQRKSLNIDPAIQNRINATTHKRVEQGFVERLMDAISPTAIARFRQAFLNKYEGIERLSRAVAEKFGADQLLAENSAIAAALQSDRAAGVAASSFRDGVPVYDKGYTYVSDLDGKVKGLIPILEPLMQYNNSDIFQAFQFYAGTKRGKRLLADGREQLFTKEDIEYGNKLEQQFPEFKDVFNEYQKYNQGLVNYMKDTGVISDKEAKLWTENWDYIPFYRQLEGETTAGPRVFSALAGVAKPKKLKGGEAELADFMETIVRNARAAIEAGMKNEAANRVVRDAVRMELAEEVPLGVTGSDIITVKEKGLTKYYRVADPLLIESMKGLNLPQMEFLSWLAAPANLLRNFVTKDPGFMIANLGRDSLQAWITSGTGMTPIVDTFKQFTKTLTNQSPEASALARAGLTGYDFSGDVASSAKMVEKELRKRGGARTSQEKALLPLTAFWDALEHGSHASDMATRAEVYKRTLERTGSEAEAFYQAMEVLNFSRKGNNAVIRVLSAMVPFFNARVQGLDVLYRSGWGKMATENSDVMKKAFASRALTMMGMSMLYWFMVSDDEEYKKLNKEERDNYWIVPALSINGKPFRFPIPFELGVVFKVLPERVLETAFGNDTGKDLKEALFRNAMSTLQFNPIPQAFVPIVENVANYSFFTGEPVVGRGMEDVAPQFQSTSSTSQFVKDLGAATGTSPIKIENLIRGYTGTMGTYAMQLLDAVYRGQGDPVKASMRLEQMPVIKRFFASDSGTVSAYYDMKGEIDQITRTMNVLERTGNNEDLKEYLQDHGKLYGLKNYVNLIDKDMKKLRQMQIAITNSTTIDADAKRQALDAIHDRQVAITARIKMLRKQFD